MLVLGVDPGSRTGFAALCDTCLIGCSTTSAANAAEVLREWHDRLAGVICDCDPLTIAIERPGSGIYMRQGTSAAAMRRIARNVGVCEARADELIRLATNLVGADRVIVKTPARGGTKRAWTPQAWLAAFGWTGKMPSNHARDAALLARRVLQEGKI